MSKKLTVYGGQLYHWGIFGQKWGKRRYQNEDGTYTEEGKERRRKTTPEERKTIKKERIGRAFTPSVKTGKDKPNVTPAGQIAKSTQDIARTSSNVLRRYDKTPQKSLSKYSDDDLRRMVNRKELEQRYNNLSSSNKKTGMEITADILDTVGDVAAIGVSAVMILDMIKRIKG